MSSYKSVLTRLSFNSRPQARRSHLKLSPLLRCHDIRDQSLLLHRSKIIWLHQNRHEHFMYIYMHLFILIKRKSLSLSSKNSQVVVGLPIIFKHSQRFHVKVLIDVFYSHRERESSQKEKFSKNQPSVGSYCYQTEWLLSYLVWMYLYDVMI